MPALVVIGAFVLSLFGGWATVSVVFRLAKVRVPTRQSEASGGYRVDVFGPTPEPMQLLRGGMWIGLLERLAITGAILVGQAGLIAAVVAIKGLGRWSELQTSPAITERFIVGTLASYVVAAGAGFLGLALLAMV